MEAEESRQKEEASRKWKEEQERLAASRYFLIPWFNFVKFGKLQLDRWILYFACSSAARIQFRLPDGSQRVHDFDPDATLQEVWDWAKGNISLPFSRFTLSTLYPRRQFANEEFTSTLRELLLVPTAVLLILPVGQLGYSSLSVIFISIVAGLVMNKSTTIILHLHKINVFEKMDSIKLRRFFNIFGSSY